VKQKPVRLAQQATPMKHISLSKTVGFRVTIGGLDELMAQHRRTCS
jgi:hypothetical protein